ncbi:hypothetical protein [Nocardioides sp. BYT-33-1]|uniref:hypothetical protein n=1 Tax=Nocardioides sp. BYT-33-1 TaxID=3416952 RepID=UPI003F529D13
MTNLRLGKSFDVLWTAMSLVGYSPVGDDILDAANFVVTLGEDAVAQFRAEIETLRDYADAAGLTSAIREDLVRKGNGKEVSDDLVQRSIELLACAGPSYFERALAVPVNEGCNEISLVCALAEAAAGRRGTVDPATFSGTMVPVRSNGRSPWILASVGLGVGYSTESPPFSDDHFLTRFYKSAAVSSQTTLWQDLRKNLGIRHLEIVLEFWPGGRGPTESRVIRRSSTRLEVQMRRDIPPLEPDLRLLGDSLAWDVMKTAYELLTSPNLGT